MTSSTFLATNVHAADPNPFNGLETVSLAELNAMAALQTRVDRKYLVAAPDLIELFGGLRSTARVLEIDGQQHSDYMSTYFDTPAFDSYLCAARSRPNRFKVRVRTYLDSDAHYLEVKTRGRTRHTIKTRCSAVAEDHEGLSGSGENFVLETLAEKLPTRPVLDHAATVAALRPTLSTHYHRTTLLIEPEANELGTTCGAEQSHDRHVAGLHRARTDAFVSCRLRHHRDQDRRLALSHRPAPVAIRTPPREGLQVRHRTRSLPAPTPRCQVEPCPAPALHVEASPRGLNVHQRELQPLRRLGAGSQHTHRSAMDPGDMTSTPSHYVRAVRRSQTGASTRRKLSRTAVAGALLVLPVACSNSDEDVFSSASTVETTTADDAVTSTSELPPSTDASTTSETATASSGVFPSGGELVVSFTYEPSTSSQAKRPYVAVWVEDGEGNLIDTISLWFDQGREGTKWLSDLSQWYQASDADDTTMSGATRVAGDYTVVWDGTDSDGNPVAAGEYVLNIESAREKGPTSYTSGTVVISDDGFTIDLDDDGELSAASAVLTA